MFGSIFIKSDEAEKSVQKTESKVTKFAKALGSGIKTAAKWGAGIAAAAGTAIAALLGVDEATREYRENMAKLNTAWESAGYSVKTAKEAYDGLYKIMGDSDAATEASQLLASVAQNAQDVAKWTDIAAGVSGAFGDALPIESLIEAANETQKVGQVTGALADALNWAGISEDEFNAKLEALGSEQERNALITQTLTEAYKASTEAYKANNAETLAARDAQLLLDEAMAKLGGAVATVKSALMSEFVPSIAEVVSAFIDFTKGVDGADKALQTSVNNMVNKIVEKLPDFLDFGIDIIVAIATGIIQNLPYLLSKAPELIGEVVKAFFSLSGELYDVGKTMFTSMWNGMKSLWTSISDWITDKVNWLMSKLAFWRSAKDEMSEEDGGGDDEPRPSHAGGLPYVPYDGYKAVLHRGERVMTAGENDNLASQIVNGLAALMESTGGTSSTRIEVPVYLDKREIARAIYDPLNDEKLRRGEA